MGKPAEVPIGEALDNDQSVCSNIAMAVPYEASDTEKDEGLKIVNRCDRHKVDEEQLDFSNADIMPVVS